MKRSIISIKLALGIAALPPKKSATEADTSNEMLADASSFSQPG